MVTGWKRPVSWMVAGASLLALAACGGGGADDDSGGDGSAITVKMFDNSFKPAEMTVKAGTRLTFKLPNVGQLPHNMHIASARGVYRESPWISEPEIINGGQSGTLTWDVPAEAGVYLFRCDYHEVEMVGTLTVE